MAAIACSADLTIQNELLDRQLFQCDLNVSLRWTLSRRITPPTPLNITLLHLASKKFFKISQSGKSWQPCFRNEKVLFLSICCFKGQLLTQNISKPPTCYPNKVTMKADHGCVCCMITLDPKQPSKARDEEGWYHEGGQRDSTAECPSQTGSPLVLDGEVCTTC